MFSSFSWSDFLWFATLVACTYYLCIGWQFYRKDIYDFLFHKRDLLQQSIKTPVKQTPDHIHKVHELVSELGLVIRNAVDDQSLKPELLFALRQKIKDFLILNDTAYKGRINLYIAEELEIYGIHGVGEEEIEGLWPPRHTP